MWQMSDGHGFYWYKKHDCMLQVSFTRGEIVKGTVVQFEPAGALIDIGAKSTAFMPTREVSTV